MRTMLTKLFTSSESVAFRPIQRQTERSRSAHLSTLDSKGDDLNPITPAEYELSLRLAIQEYKQAEQQPQAIQTENILPIVELVDAELMQDHQKLIETLVAKTKISEEHQENKFIDIESEEIASQIEEWTRKLIKEIETKRSLSLNQDDIYELEALSWFHFDSLINVSNARSLELDIAKFYESSNFYKLGNAEQKKKREELLNSLEKKYPLKKDELEILIDLVTSKKDSMSLFKAIKEICGQYELGKRKGAIAKIISGYVVSSVIPRITPFFFQYGVAYPSMAIVLGNCTSNYFTLKASVQEAELMNYVKSKINERIVRSLFFKEYEFTQARSQGEIFMTIERGKESTIKLLSESISGLVPHSFGIVTALIGLTAVNPILSGINLLAVPIRYFTGRAYNKTIQPIHEALIERGEQIATEVGGIKGGLQEILTSPRVPEIADSLKEKVDERDRLTLEESINRKKMRFAGNFTLDGAVAVSAGAGLVLYEMDQIPEGAVYSSLIYSATLNAPFENLMDMYFDRVVRYIQDIERMEEVLGKVDELDLPDGEKENKRIGVSRLGNYNISIRNLGFRDILDSFNLDIGEGEFVTIVGSSGSGKSTLLRNIVGLYKPDSGSVQIGGVDIDDIKKYGEESIYSIMSYCNQDPQIFQGMTLRENLMLWSNKKLSDDHLKKILEDLNLHKFTDKLDEKIDHFSPGEKVRLGVARTLIKGAKIMLLDEPTASLDSEAASEIIKILETIRENYQDTTIICVTHDERLKQGRVINLSTEPPLAGNPQIPRTLNY